MVHMLLGCGSPNAPWFADLEVLTEVVQCTPGLGCPSVPEKDGREERDSGHRHPPQDSDGPKLGRCEFSADDQTPPEEGDSHSTVHLHYKAHRIMLLLHCLFYPLEHSETETRTGPAFLPL